MLDQLPRRATESVFKLDATSMGGAGDREYKKYELV